MSQPNRNSVTNLADYKIFRNFGGDVGSIGTVETDTGTLMVSLPHSIGNELNISESIQSHTSSFLLEDLFSEFNFVSQSEKSTEKEGADTSMDDATKMILERLERDSREREERYHSDAKERENRYRQDMKEREERFIQNLKDSTQRIENEIKDVKESVNRSEVRLNETAKHVHSMATANLWGGIATIVGIVAICITLWLAFKPPNTSATIITPTTSQAPVSADLQNK